MRSRKNNYPLSIFNYPLIGGGYAGSREQVTGKRDKKVAYDFEAVASLLPLPSSLKYFFVALIFVIAILLVGCDLFQPADPDYIKKLDEEVAWANAAWLTVTVTFPNEWGVSPNTGTNRCYDAVRTNENPRQGYPFNVEFTASREYGFIEWLAFNINDYSLSQIIAMDKDERAVNSLNGKNSLTGTVVITEAEETNTGAMSSTVTINANVPVVLVPFCDNRPHVARSNPPLIPTLNAFPYDQRISVWFNMSVKPDSVIMGETIRITAIYTTGADNGAPFVKNEKGIIITDGDISKYFTASFPDAGQPNMLFLTVKNDYPAEDLSLLSISVEIGPGVQNLDGFVMSAAQTITYVTGTSESKKIYEALYIHAGRVGSSLFFQDANTQWNNPAIDRRFNNRTASPDLNIEGLNLTDIDKVQIRFSVINPEGVTQPPNRVTVIEEPIFDLNGDNFPDPQTQCGETYILTTPDSDGIYTITHALQTSVSGIIQLMVIPYYFDTDEVVRNRNDTGNIVTIALDTASPVLNTNPLNTVNATISGGNFNSDDDVYDFSASANMTVTLENLILITDNGSNNGILSIEAWEKPWTCDDWCNVQWRIRVVGPSVSAGYFNTSWQPAVINNLLNNTCDISLGDLKLDTPYTVNVQFRDRVGNVMMPENPVLGTIRKIDVAIPLAANGLSATVNPVGNGLTVSWTTPEDEGAVMLGARVYINGEHKATITDTGEKTTSIAVDTIFKDNVISGFATSGFTPLNIEVVAYNATGNAPATTLTAWNVPDMYVTQTNTAIINEQLEMSNEQIAALFTQSGITNIVLTSDITLDDWTPVNLTNRRFYGNGNTITITGLSNVQNTGLFGIVQGTASNPAEIRDLCVEYDNVSLERSGTLYFGGIAGQTNGSTVIRNVIVGGKKGKVTLTNTLAATYAGIITGQLQPTALIENCFAGLELIIEATTTNSYDIINAGGIAGFISDQSVAADKIMIDSVTVDGIVDASCAHLTSTSSLIYLGGIAGSNEGLGIIQNSIVSGVLRMAAASSYKSNNSMFFICGGIIGRMWRGHIASCNFIGSIVIPAGYSTAKQTHIGGVAGSIGRILTDNNITIETLTSQVTVKDTSASGNISLSVVSGAHILVGGVTAAACGGANTINNIIFENCEYSGGDITFERKNTRGSLHIGGFAGDVMNNVDFINCRSLAGIIKIDHNDGATMDGNIGGFVSVLRGSVEYCYSLSPITVNPGIGIGDSSNIPNCIVGGFAGGISGVVWSGIIVPPLGYWPIRRCYTSGDITVNLPDTAYFKVITGGFIGDAGKDILIEDCYATGNISVDRPGSGSNGCTYTGGFAGYMDQGTNTDCELRRCFSTGSITTKVQRDANSSDNEYFTGGLVGKRYSGIIRNCIVLGSSVTLQGGGSNSTYRGLGRISGNAAGSGTHVNNYHINTIKLFYTNAYSDNSLIEASQATGLTNKEGLNVSITDALSSVWWQRTLNFDNTVWDFSTPAVYRGYPLLQNVSGQ